MVATEEINEVKSKAPFIPITTFSTNGERYRPRHVIFESELKGLATLSSPLPTQGKPQ